MRLENTFEVPAAPASAWELLNDIPKVIPCLPGASLDEAVDESHWRATVHVKLGPIALQFGTDIERREADAEAWRAVLAARARELKGRGGAQATITSTLAPAGAGTRVTIATELTLQGAVAQYGRGIVADVANQLVQRFADCLAGKLQDGEAPAATEDRAPAPVAGLRLALAALWRRLLAVVRPQSK